MITVLMGEKTSIEAPPVDPAKETGPQAAAGTVSALAANAPAAETRP
jgi:hypothetical protein